MYTCEINRFKITGVYSSILRKIVSCEGIDTPEATSFEVPATMDVDMSYSYVKMLITDNSISEFMLQGNYAEIRSIIDGSGNCKIVSIDVCVLEKDVEDINTPEPLNTGCGTWLEKIDKQEVSRYENILSNNADKHLEKALNTFMTFCIENRRIMLFRFMLATFEKGTFEYDPSTGHDNKVLSGIGSIILAIVKQISN